MLRGFFAELIGPEVAAPAPPPLVDVWRILAGAVVIACVVAWAHVLVQPVRAEGGPQPDLRGSWSLDTSERLPCKIVLIPGSASFIVMDEGCDPAQGESPSAATSSE